ncbi:uncharacterized protein HMPREF1541_00110 [Cyphellophora europaea CBS 101466]|uniref:Cytochrome P450 n=1 Tax=Cyphellophora europaea (strain CBS 101466) TaxID=1220924 RepID=W2SD45_CYPE1|nr:uncharacterized protein HMPREF1541_00110 [Cyphellophora europaea CBS 101466]ETN45928.1 hypothetical protein HMPREF1541_00110 [Cyphellophora europaea CBS 101466]
MSVLGPLSGSLLLDFVLLLFALYISACIRSYRHLKHIPGPNLWAWSVIPLFWTHLRGDIFDKFDDLNRQYGPLVRIAPKTLLVSDPEVLRRMSAARSPYTRSDWYLAMRLIPGKDNVLSTRDEKHHDDLRRKMASGYSGKENPSLEQDIDECVLDLVKLIDTKYLNLHPGQVVRTDLARKIQYFTSDIMSKLAFDAKFNDLSEDKDNFGYIHEVETIFPSIFCTCTIPAVVTFLTSIGFLKLFAPSVNSTFGLGKVLGITRSQVAKRFDKNGKPEVEHKDMLASFIRHGLSQEEAEQESVMQLAAGSDTTATGLRATLLCIITNPRVHTKLLAEIDQRRLSGETTSSSNSIISDQEARELTYLQACIKEGLRWYPPIAGMLSKKTPAEGDTLCGYPVPGNVSIGYSAKAVHRSATLFGPDEDVFRPERWIHKDQGGDETSADKLKAMERNNELVFGHGKYQCLGKSVAALELNKVIFELLRRYQITLVNPTQPWVSSCYGIHLQRDMWVTIRGRRQTYDG